MTQSSNIFLLYSITIGHALLATLGTLVVATYHIAEHLIFARSVAEQKEVRNRILVEKIMNDDGHCESQKE